MDNTKRSIPVKYTHIAGTPIFTTTINQNITEGARMLVVLQRFLRKTGLVIADNTWQTFNYGQSAAFQVEGQATSWYSVARDSGDHSLYKVYRDEVQN